MNVELTELVFILDRSGSMNGLESDTIGGFNGMIFRQKAEGKKVNVTTVLFDDEVEIIHDRFPIDIVEPLSDKNHKYMTYEKASRLYGIPYWAFVSVAKMAQATWKLRKTAMVDIVVFEKYLEEHCLVTEDEDVNYEMEDYVMPRTRKEVENLEELVKSKKKKYVRSGTGPDGLFIGDCHDEDYQ